jgi:putative transposase
MAIDARLGKRTDPGTIIHFDQGVQFGSWAFTERPRDSGLLASMGSIGDCYDNSMIARAGQTPAVPTGLLTFPPS